MLLTSHANAMLQPTEAQTQMCAGSLRQSNSQYVRNCSILHHQMSLKTVPISRSIGTGSTSGGLCGHVQRRLTDVVKTMQTICFATLSGRAAGITTWAASVDASTPHFMHTSRAASKFKLDRQMLLYIVSLNLIRYRSGSSESGSMG